MINESAFITTDGGYSLTAQPSQHSPGNAQSFVLNQSTPNNIAQLGVQVSTATQALDSFSFEHNLWQFGTGSATFTTQVQDTLTNSSSAAATMRFDTQITPGHIAMLGNDPGNTVYFQFQITQITGSLNFVLYSANGVVNPSAAPVITTSDGKAFNGLQSYSNGTGRALDWSATNLSLLLNPIPESSSSIILYSMTTYVSGGLPCASLSRCEGTQVAFGDPRNNGTVTPPGAFAAFRSAAPLVASARQPLIGGQFDAHTIFVNVVNVDAPLPLTPPVLPPVDYIQPGVPEPAAWAFMITGFVMVGAATRRRRDKSSYLKPS